MTYLNALAALALIVGCLSACGSAPRNAGNEAGAARSVSVEVFGTIDAAVTHTTTRSGR